MLRLTRCARCISACGASPPPRVRQALSCTLCRHAHLRVQAVAAAPPCTPAADGGVEPVAPAGIPSIPSSTSCNLTDTTAPPTGGKGLSITAATLPGQTTHSCEQQYSQAALEARESLLLPTPPRSDTGSDAVLAAAAVGAPAPGPPAGGGSSSAAAARAGLGGSPPLLSPTPMRLAPAAALHPPVESLAPPPASVALSGQPPQQPTCSSPRAHERNAALLPVYTQSSPPVSPRGACAASPVKTSPFLTPHWPWSSNSLAVSEGGNAAPPSLEGTAHGEGLGTATSNPMPGGCVREAHLCRMACVCAVCTPVHKHARICAGWCMCVL